MIVTLIEEHTGLKQVLQNVIRKLFGHKRNEVISTLRKKELRGLFVSEMNGVTGDSMWRREIHSKLVW
jgi:hypothetical protein